MPKTEDLSGRVYGRLTVTKRAERPISAKRGTYWHCVCSCGGKTVARKDGLQTGVRISCGCINRTGEAATTHGLTGGRAFTSWQEMKRRCTNPNFIGWKYYGGRGITVHAAWMGRKGFPAFYADMGPCPDGFSLDRIDVNGNYEPGNFRWSDSITQQNNTRKNKRLPFDGKTLTVREILIQTKSSVPLRNASLRINAGWTIEDAVSVPVSASNSRHRG